MKHSKQYVATSNIINSNNKYIHIQKQIAVTFYTYQDNTQSSHPSNADPG